MFDGHKEKNGMMEEAERIEKNKNENQGLTGGQQEQVDNEKNGADLAAAAGHRATRATRWFLLLLFVSLCFSNLKTNNKKNKVQKTGFSFVSSSFSSNIKKLSNRWKMLVALIISNTPKMKQQKKKKWKQIQIDFFDSSFFPLNKKEFGWTQNLSIKIKSKSSEQKKKNDDNI